MVLNITRYFMEFLMIIQYYVNIVNVVFILFAFRFVPCLQYNEVKNKDRVSKIVCLVNHGYIPVGHE